MIKGVKKIQKIIVTLLFIFGASNYCSSQDITINTDRPDQSDGVSTVPKWKFQIEEGITLAENTAINNIMLRLGITNSTEIRLLLDAGKELNSFGIKPIAISVKQRMIKQMELIPAISFVGYLSYSQIATKDFQSEKWPFELKLAFENEITDKVSLGYNIGTSNEFENLNLTAGVGYAITNELSSFAEYFSTFRKLDNEHNIDIGIMYLITPLTKVDLTFGHAIFAKEDRFFASFGISCLFL